MRRSVQDPCVNLGQGDQKAADYVKINPTARIPTLIDPEGPGGKPLTVTQSWAILMYLCEKTGKFLPADPVARVRMFQWMAEGGADSRSKARKSSSHKTRRWRGESAANSSLKMPNSLLAGKIQGISPIRGLAAP